MFFFVFLGGVAAMFIAAIAKVTALTINIMISSYWEEMLSLWSCLLFSSQAMLHYSVPAVTKWSGLLVNLCNWVTILKVRFDHSYNMSHSSALGHIWLDWCDSSDLWRKHGKCCWCAAALKMTCWGGLWGILPTFWKETCFRTHCRLKEDEMQSQWA